MEQEFAAAIEIISTQLGIAAERIFYIFAEAQVVIGIVNIVSAIIALILTYLVYRYSIRATKRIFDNKDGIYATGDREFAIILIPVLVTIFAFLLIAIILSTHNHDIIRIICPEYTAMKEIIELMLPNVQN